MAEAQYTKIKTRKAGWVFLVPISRVTNGQFPISEVNSQKMAEVPVALIDSATAPAKDIPERKSPPKDPFENVSSRTYIIAFTILRTFLDMRDAMKTKSFDWLSYGYLGKLVREGINFAVDPEFHMPNVEFTKVLYALEQHGYIQCTSRTYGDKRLITSCLITSDGVNKLKGQRFVGKRARK